MECVSNPNCESCKECMKDMNAPYSCCCKDECGEHEFCTMCETYRSWVRKARDEGNI